MQPLWLAPANYDVRLVAYEIGNPWRAQIATIPSYLSCPQPSHPTPSQFQFTDQTDFWLTMTATLTWQVGGHTQQPATSPPPPPPPIAILTKPRSAQSRASAAAPVHIVSIGTESCEVRFAVSLHERSNPQAQAKAQTSQRAA
jgi:hypothetical protein